MVAMPRDCCSEWRIVRAAHDHRSRAAPLLVTQPNLDRAAAVTLPPTKLEAELHAERERHVVRRLAIQVERRGFLEVELAEVVLRHQSNAEVRAELHIDAATEVVRDV